jgi:hypothetical protein
MAMRRRNPNFADTLTQTTEMSDRETAIASQSGWGNMAHIIVFTHEYDSFNDLHWPFSPAARGHLLLRVVRAAEKLGHTWRVVKGPQPCVGDAAILHVDATVVASEYAALSGSFARAINFSALDISKRNVSDALLALNDAWDGPVMVKSNLNFGGHREWVHNREADRRRRTIPHPGAVLAPAYTVLNNKDEVPDAVWRDPTFVVERFVPERVPEGYAMRVWLFMGASERCMRHTSASPIIKADNTLYMEPVEVHPSMREKRRRLGFDYGKFDYVEYNGKAVLLDANRTPGAPPRKVDELSDFGRGLHDLIVG